MRKTVEEVFGLSPVAHPPLILAPMAGYSNAAMRLICHRHGATLSYTEMTSDRGLLHASDKTWQLLETFVEAGRVVGHLYGSEPQIMAEAAARAAATGRFCAIDLNAGCPVKKITCNGSGAALVKNPQRVHNILRAMRCAIDLPLTIKTRLGPQPDKVMIFELLRAAEEAGADALALHARFTSQGHGGAPNFDLMAEVKARARIPIIGNGGIRSPHDAWHMLRETSVDALMIGRAAIGNPWIFSDISNALAQGDEPPHSRYAGERPQRTLNVVESALEAHLEAELALIHQLQEKGYIANDATTAATLLAVTFRCHLFRYLHGLKGSSWLRGNLCQLHNIAEIRTAVRLCLEREAAYRCGMPPPTT